MFKPQNYQWLSRWRHAEFFAFGLGFVSFEELEAIRDIRSFNLYIFQFVSRANYIFRYEWLKTSIQLF